MIKLGITGGIGSGKTTVCHFFSLLGIPVYNSDLRAKILMNNSEEIRENIMSLFGNDIYLTNGTLNRKKLSKLVFNSKCLLQKLNNIVHPAVREDFLLWTKSVNSKYIIQESAILIDSGFYKAMDKVITVTAPINDKIKRVITRDNCSKNDVLNRMNNQISDEERFKFSDFIIQNGDNNLIISKILEIDKKLNNE